MSIKKWLLSLVASVFMVTAVFANDDDDKVFSLPRHSALCSSPILKNLPKCDAFIKLKGHSGSVNSVTFSPERDGKQFLASGSNDKTIKIWDTYDWKKPPKDLNGHTNPVTAVVFSEDGKLFASHDEKTIIIWNEDTKENLYTHVDHEREICSVDISPNGQLLASVGRRSIEILNPNNGKLLHTLKSHKDLVSVKFSLDGQLLASGSRDNEKIKVWKTSDWGLIHDLKGHKWAVDSVAFSPVSQLLASGDREGVIKIWNLNSGDLLRTLEAHVESLTRTYVNSVAFSPDGQLLASGSNDTTIIIWHLDKILK